MCCFRLTKSQALTPILTALSGLKNGMLQERSAILTVPLKDQSGLLFQILLREGKQRSCKDGWKHSDERRYFSCILKDYFYFCNKK